MGARDGAGNISCRTAGGRVENFRGVWHNQQMRTRGRSEKRNDTRAKSGKTAKLGRQI